MKLQFSDHFNANDWDETVSRLGGAIFHSSVWARYNTAVRANLSELYVTCHNDSGNVVGAALAFIEKPRYRITGFFSKRMLLDATPAVNHDDSVLDEFLVELEKYCREKGFVRLSIFSYSSPDISEKLAKCDYDLTRRYEFVLDLDRTEEQLWRGLSKTLRKNINRAKRTGVTIRELPAGESIASLVKLSAESADMIERRKGIDLRQSNIGVYQSAAMFLEAGRGRFFSAVADGEIVSTSLFTLFNGVVNHNLAGSSEQAYIINAPKYLLWHAILSYKVEGAGVFNLGGVKADATEPDSLEHGVYDYKRAFGTRILECASGEKILGTKRVKFINLVKSIARG